MSTQAAAAPTELGTKPVGSLLKEFAIPGIIAQTAASLYNMVDSIYIGHIPDVGSYAISGLAVTFPLMNLSVAMGTLVGVGAMTLVSILLGQRNYDAAAKVMSNSLTLNVLVGLVFSVVSIIFLEPILRFFGASDNTLPYAYDYMLIILLGNIVTHLYHGMNGIVRSSGHPRTAMALTLFTVISNAVLDPILIFGFNMGIRGAAIATVVCQVAALVYTMRFLMDKRRFLHFAKPMFQLDSRISARSLSIGVGPFLMNLASCVVALLINQQLRKYGGDLAIGAYGITNRVIFVFAMICMGFNQGLQPIAGYNYGARLYSRVKKVFILTARWEVLVTTVCCLVCVLVPGVAVRLFTSDPEMIEISVHGMRISGCCFALVGLNMATGNFFQCMGMVGKSIFLSLSRQLLFLVPFLYLLPLRLGQDGVWISFPLSDGIAIIVSFIMIYNIFRKFNRLSDGDDPSSLGGSI